MAKPSLAALKNAFKSQTNEENRETLPNNYYPFWNMKPGERAVVRFIPDKNENNPRGFLVEKVFHNLTINGQKKMVPCLSMYGDDCPICKLSQEYYKAKDEVNGKKYWRKKQYIAQALIVEDPLPPNKDTGETHEGKIRYFALGYQIYKIIADAFASDELEEVPTDFENGYDFIIKKTEQGGFASYTVGTKFANKQRALTEEELAVVDENMIDLSTLLPKNPGVKKVQAMLNADINGGDIDNEDSSVVTEDEEVERPRTTTAKKPVARTAVVDDDEPPFEPTPKSSKPIAKAPTKPAVEETEGMDDVEAMLATIRARRAAAAAKGE